MVRCRLGFTMIELLVVIAIIGVLAAVMLAGFNPIRQLNRARDARSIADVKAIANAMEQYYAVEGEYANLGHNAECNDSHSLLTEYINPFPISSSDSFEYRCSRTNPVGKGYCIVVPLREGVGGNCKICTCTPERCSMDTSSSNRFCVVQQQ